MQFTALKAAEICGGRIHGENISMCRSWFTNSSDIEKGGAFIALPGAVTDGHKYISDALSRGAKIVLANKSKMNEYGCNETDFPDTTFIFTENTEEALVLIAENYIKQIEPIVIGITGSVGKTTTRELAFAALDKTYKIHAAKRSFNTLIGCSLTVLSMPEDTEVLLLELGTNHFGEISEMVKHFPIQIAVITEVVAAHLEGFGSIEGVLRAKTEICNSKKLKAIIYNNDNMLIREYMSYNCNNVIKIPVGKSEKSVIKIEDTQLIFENMIPKSLFSYSYNGEKFTLSSHLLGDHNAYNIGFASAVAISLEKAIEDFIDNISNMLPVSGRGIWKTCGDNSFIVDEAYNANPASMSAAIENVKNVSEIASLKKIAILGGMKELGSTSKNLHNKIADKLDKFDYVLLLGDEWKECNLLSNMHLCATFDELMVAALSIKLKNTIVLVKGSNSFGLKKIVAKIEETEKIK